MLNVLKIIFNQIFNLFIFMFFLFLFIFIFISQHLRFQSLLNSITLLLCAGAGKVLRWRVPSGSGAFTHEAAVRVDSGVREGDVVGTHYDPMIAKLVTHGPDRETALAMMRKALAETQVGFRVSGFKA